MSKVTYLIGNASCLAIIPKDLARKQGIDDAGNIVIEEVENGLVIKRPAVEPTASRTESSTQNLVESYAQR